jgi:hypothetical protein
MAKVGQVIKLGTEQMLVRLLGTKTATVDRAINGTTGAKHTSSEIYAWEARLAVVSPWPRYEDEGIAAGPTELFMVRPRFAVMFMGSLLQGEAEQDSIWSFLETLGAIQGEMKDAAGTAGYLRAERFELVDLDIENEVQVRSGESAIWAVLLVEA